MRDHLVEGCRIESSGVNGNCDGEVTSNLFGFNSFESSSRQNSRTSRTSAFFGQFNAQELNSQAGAGNDPNIPNSLISCRTDSSRSLDRLMRRNI